MRKYRTKHFPCCNLLILYLLRFSPSTRISDLIRNSKCQSYAFIRSECKQFVASSKTWCKYFSYRMFTSSSVNASAVFNFFFVLLFCKSFVCSFQTFPCLVKLFVVDSAYGIIAFFKLFLFWFLLDSFLYCCPWMNFSNGFV